jgi:hypothetical protein
MRIIDKNVRRINKLIKKKLRKDIGEKDNPKRQYMKYIK